MNTRRNFLKSAALVGMMLFSRFDSYLGEDNLVLDSKGLEIELFQYELPRKNGDTPEDYPLAYGTGIGKNHFKISRRLVNCPIT